MTPVVSICCITYNHHLYIEKCIEGFLMQKTNFSIEILIHDDASTDGTTEIVKSYAEKYPNIIKSTLQTENQFSKGKKITPILMSKAKGKYIALCEGDDYWTDPLKLQKQVDFLEENEGYSLVCGGYKSLNENIGETEIVLKTVEQSPDNTDRGFEITIERFLNQWLTKSLTLIFRSDTLDYGIFKKYKYFRDVHLNYSLLREGKGFYMKEILGVYRVHSGGVFSEISEKNKYVSFLNAYGELYRKNKSDKYLKQKYYRLLKNANNTNFDIAKPYVFYFKMFLISKSIKDFKLFVKSILNISE